MGLAKYYKPEEAEIRLQTQWQAMGIYHFKPDSDAPVYSIDTPPPTVSGNLHLGHVYSYSHPDFIARFYRMNGYNVFYPMGYDDNGLPTERLVEKRLGINALQIGRQNFIKKCLEISEEAEKDYQELWKRLGLSIDWRYTYRTIDDHSRRCAQQSFIELYRQGLAYRREAPTIWCPECQAAIAQAELIDLERSSELITLDFRLEDGKSLPIATTRPELLPACVAIFVHPEDQHFNHLVGQKASVPYFGQVVPILADPQADPEKGTGAVMCCTFGDTTDVAWWQTHHLPLIETIDGRGKLTAPAGDFAGLPIPQARRQIKAALQAKGLVLGSQPILQSVRAHERCDTPIEYFVTRQWFVRVLDLKAALIADGEKVAWHPDHMQARYRAWVENLNWDWCISRQRYFGTPFPVWYCQDCGEVLIAEEAQLPVDPLEQAPGKPCSKCGHNKYLPEKDIFDTWMTSSLSPQIGSGWLEDEQLYQKVFPMSMRPQAHEIIRTWAFYTILNSRFHFGILPWKNVLISGWGLAGEGMGKISKSRGGGPMAPMEMLSMYSADAVRYWTASTGPGKDAIISEEKIQMGAKLVTKIWNVARFSQRFLEGYIPPAVVPSLTSADRWILSRTQQLIRRVTELFSAYEYAAAKTEIEVFFWKDLADNYLEMAKQRLYNPASLEHEGGRFCLYHVLLTVIELFAPLLPYITEEIYLGIFTTTDGARSIHNAHWPEPEETLDNEAALNTGELLVEIATAVRRYKSEQNLSLGSDIKRLQLAADDPKQVKILQEASHDLMSITRAKQIEVMNSLDDQLEVIEVESPIKIGIEN